MMMKEVRAGVDVMLIVDSVESIVWEFDLATKHFTMVSRQAERMLGYPVEEWIRDPTFWETHMHPDDRAWAPAYCQTETTRLRGHEFDYRMIAKDGRVVWLRDIVTVVVENDRPTRLRGIMVDITRGKEAELERARLLVAEREARATAEEALRLREDFLSIASHELRTPLTPLLLQIQRFRSYADRLSAVGAERDALFRCIDASERSAKRFGVLLDSLLDASQFEARSLVLDRSRADLGELTRNVLEEFEAALQGAGCAVSFDVASPAVGMWDAMRVSQVITNVFSNAIKYGPGQPIDVRVEVRGEKARLSVRDRGIGVPLADTGRIFDKFVRAASMRHYGGFGIGLYIARRLVEAQGGELRVEKTDGPGATFVLELPLA